jgi:hypothetical protein
MAVAAGSWEPAPLEPVSLHSQSVTLCRQPESSIVIITLPRAKLFHEEPEAGILHIRICAVVRNFPSAAHSLYAQAFVFQSAETKARSER